MMKTRAAIPTQTRVELSYLDMTFFPRLCMAKEAQAFRPTSRIFAQDIPSGPKGGAPKRYCVMDFPFQDIFIKIGDQLIPRDAHWYVVLGVTPVLPFFDFDFNKEKPHTRDDIHAFVKLYYELCGTPRESQCYYVFQTTGKMSHHVHMTNCTPVTLEELKEKVMACNAKSSVQADKCVYAADRPFRLENQSKLSNPTGNKSLNGIFPMDMYPPNAGRFEDPFISLIHPIGPPVMYADMRARQLDCAKLLPSRRARDPLTDFQLTDLNTNLRVRTTDASKRIKIWYENKFQCVVEAIECEIIVIEGQIVEYRVDLPDTKFCTIANREHRNRRPHISALKDRVKVMCWCSAQPPVELHWGAGAKPYFGPL